MLCKSIVPVLNSFVCEAIYTPANVLLYFHYWLVFNASRCVSKSYCSFFHAASSQLSPFHCTCHHLLKFHSLASLFHTPLWGEMYKAKMILLCWSPEVLFKISILHHPYIPLCLFSYTFPQGLNTYFLGCTTHWPQCDMFKHWTIKIWQLVILY